CHFVRQAVTLMRIPQRCTSRCSAPAEAINMNPFVPLSICGSILTVINGRTFQTLVEDRQYITKQDDSQVQKKLGNSAHARLVIVSDKCLNTFFRCSYRSFCRCSFIRWGCRYLWV